MSGRQRQFQVMVLLVLCVVNAYSVSSVASSGPAFRQIGVSEGLPDNHVEAMVQDRQGFVWIATRSGLVRHEGTSIRRVPLNQPEQEALVGANVVTLAAANTGSVWASVSGRGVVEVGPDLTVLRHLRTVSDQGRLSDANVWSITEDCDGNIWLAFMTGGVARYAPATDELNLIAQQSEYGLSEHGFQMHLDVDRNCRVWLVQSNQLSVLETDSELQFLPVLERTPGEALMTGLTVLTNGDLLLHHGQQLKRIHRHEDRWQVSIGIETPGFIVDVAEHADGWLSLATYEGLVRWHRESNRLYTIAAAAGLRDGLPSSEVLHMLLDREGGLWVSVARSGIAYLSPESWAFERFQQRFGQREGGLDGLPMQEVYGVLASARDDQLWIAGRTEGLHRLDLSTGRTQPASVLFGQAALDDIERINRLEWLDDELIIAWSSYIEAFNTKTRALDRLFDSQAMDVGNVQLLGSNGRDQLWFSTFEDGVFQYHKATQQLTHYQPGERGLTIPATTRITALADDPSGDWWLAAGRTLFQFDPMTQRFTQQLELDQGIIRALWFEDDGVYLATDQTIHYWQLSPTALAPRFSQTFRNLVPGGRPFKIQKEAPDSYWLLLTSGLIHFDATLEAIDFIGPARGLAVGELLENAFSVLPDGRYGLGGTQGLALFAPSELPILPAVPEVQMLKITSGDQDMPLHDEIALAHWQRDLELEFAAPSFVDPARLRYRVRLLGEHRAWTEVQDRNVQQYFHLSPGNYQFQVQAAGRSGRWQEPGTSVSIGIAYPFWRQSLAYLIYGLVLIVSGVWAYKIWRQTAARKQQLAQAEQDRQVAERANQAKSDFLAVMSHEMRTPLHGVMGMLDLIQGRVQEPQINELINTVQRSGHQLKRIVDDVLDLSKIEAEQLSLDSSVFELMPVVEQAMDLYAPMAASTGLELRLRASSELASVAVGDRDRLMQVIGNLLSNAIKFTRSGGIELELTQTKNERESSANFSTLKIRVSDSGPGVSASQRQRLFQKFQQLGHVSSSGQVGSGLGLTITRRLVVAMGGQVDVISRPRPLRGACFEVVLPEYLCNAPLRIRPQLISGLRVDSLVSASDSRILHRLARRWGFYHRRSLHSSGNAGQLIVLDPCMDPLPDSFEAYAACLYIDRPTTDAPQTWLQSARFIPIGWPVTERRLLRILIAWAHSTRSAKVP